jgi:nitrogen fixation NifU-like protein
MYSDLVMEHFRNPRNVGEVDDPDGVGEIGNPVCGDVMRLTIKVADGRIADIKFKTFGCGAAVATSSMVTEMVMGKTLDEALEVSNRAVAEALGGLPPAKMHCSNLAADALHIAVDDYLERSGEAAPGARAASQAHADAETLECCDEESAACTLALPGREAHPKAPSS